MEVTTMKLRYSVLNGINHPSFLSPKCFEEITKYKPLSGDVFISSYLKCGSTWLTNIVLYIMHKGKEVGHPVQYVTHAPYLDMLGQEGIDRMPRPGPFKTHLPYKLLPLSPDAKYIFVARNPKDSCVSYFHFSKDHPGVWCKDGAFDDFFEFFMSGELFYNDYFDHLLDWYPHRNDPNVFYTTYERMTADLTCEVLRLAEFLGKEYLSAIENDNAVLGNILKFSSFDYMRENINPFLGRERMVNQALGEMYSGLAHFQNFIATVDPIADRVVEFARKGTGGEWKKYFSPDQNDRMNKKFLQKFKGTDVLLWFPMEGI